MKKKFASVAIGFASVVSLAFVVNNFPDLVDSGTLVGIFAPLIILGAAFKMHGVSPAHLWETTGIPLAVIVTCIGLIQMLHHFSDATGVYGATGVAFSAIVWGGIAGCFGYCVRPKHIDEARVPKASKVLLCIFLIGFLLWEMHVTAGIDAFLMADAGICVLLPVSLYTSVNSLNGYSIEPSKCLQLVILGCLGGVAIAIFQYLIGMSDKTAEGIPQIGPALALGLLAIFYCAVILLLTAVLLDNKARQSIAFSRLNWQLLGIFALINLVAFAPMTLAELSAQ